MNRLLIMVVCAAIGYGLAACGVYRYAQWEQIEQRRFYVMLGILVLGIYISLSLGAFSSFGDANDFKNMMEQMDLHGFQGIYENQGINYPPLFWIIYYPVCKLLKLVGIPFDASVRGFILAIKLPCILMNYMVAWLLVRAIPEKEKYTDIVMLFFLLLNPGIILTTDYICQIDLLYIGFQVCCIYCLSKGRLAASYFLLVAAFLVKFQAIFITPVVLLATLEQVILSDFQWENFVRKLTAGLSAIALIFLSYLPFRQGAGSTFLNNFSNTTAGFGKASQNACNFWMLVGYSQVPINEKLGMFSCQMWGNIFIVCVVMIAAVLFWRFRKDATVYPLVAACLVSGTYTFSVKMMSRYLYPAIFLIYLAYALKPTKRRFACAAIYSVIYILVIGMDFIVYPWIVYDKSLIAPYVVSALVILGYVYLIQMIWREKER